MLIQTSFVQYTKLRLLKFLKKLTSFPCYSIFNLKILIMSMVAND